MTRAGATRVAHLTSVHAEGDPRIVHKECRTLVDAGYDVVLVVPRASDAGPSDAPVRVHAVPLPASRRERFLRTTRQVYRAALEEDAALYHFHDPELIPIGLLLKLRGRRVIMDVHEDLPRQIAAKPWIHERLRGPVAMAAEVAERIAAAAFDGIVAAAEVIAPHFPADKTILARNFPMLDNFEVADPIPWAERDNVVAYVGALTELRGARKLVEAIALVPERLGARLVLAGRFGPASLEAELRRLPGWRRTEYRGWLGRAEIRDLLGRAKIGANLLHPVPQYLGPPSGLKLPEYMVSNLVVLMSDFPRWYEFLDRHGGGVFVDPLDERAIAARITELLDDPVGSAAIAGRGMESARRHLNWASEGRRLTELYERVLAR